MGALLTAGILVSHSTLKRVAGGAKWHFISGGRPVLQKLGPSLEGTLPDCL